MKIVTFKSNKNTEHLGVFISNKVFSLENISEKTNSKLPKNINSFLENFDENYTNLKKLLENLDLSSVDDELNYSLLSPITKPNSVRDAYAFRQHVETSRKNRGVNMIPEFDQFPVFYFTNHNAIIGEGDVVIEEDHLLKLDFELEVALVIGKQGKNISSKNADDYIAGFTIMNDFSARQLQMEEMKLNLGPAKGKDFATSLGPYLVTLDELNDRKIVTDNGNKYDLEMKAYHNKKLISVGNFKDISWTFAEIIERVSYGVEIYPGDVIGSGTVGTGCYLEVNGTRSLNAKNKNEDYTPIWLKNNDVITLEIEKLGALTNTIKLSKNNYSILEKKKL